MMESYLTEELPSLIASPQFNCGVNARGVFGHSMGGHGALTLGLKRGDIFSSVSAFAPICNPTKGKWGQKAFTGYLGAIDKGKDHDATELLKKNGAKFEDILIDQGDQDQFLESGELLPENFIAAAKEIGQKVTYREQKGYDHSYFFINSFVSDHVKFHAKKLHLVNRNAEFSSIEEIDSSTAGKPIVCKAMVARGPKQPLTEELITVAPPRAGEVRVKVMAVSTIIQISQIGTVLTAANSKELLYRYKRSSDDKTSTNEKTQRTLP